MEPARLTGAQPGCCVTPAPPPPFQAHHHHHHPHHHHCVVVYSVDASATNTTTSATILRPLTLMHAALMHASTETHAVQDQACVSRTWCLLSQLMSRPPDASGILTQALMRGTRIDHQRVRYACGMRAYNKADRGWGHTPCTSVAVGRYH